MVDDGDTRERLNCKDESIVIDLAWPVDTSFSGAEMELLTKQMEGISEQTIAEILEQEPEMRKEIEEELENNVWAP